jgi:hypothetical protein
MFTLLKEWSIIDKVPRIGYSLELACRVWNRMRTRQGPYLYGIKAPVKGPYELGIPLMKLKFWPLSFHVLYQLVLESFEMLFLIRLHFSNFSYIFQLLCFVLFCFFGSKCIGFNFPFNLKMISMSFAIVRSAWELFHLFFPLDKFYF